MIVRDRDSGMGNFASGMMVGSMLGGGWGGWGFGWGWGGGMGMHHHYGGWGHWGGGGGYHGGYHDTDVNVTNVTNNYNNEDGGGDGAREGGETDDPGAQADGTESN